MFPCAIPLTLQDMFLVPEEFALPSVSLKRYLKLNTPFYPNFSNELLNACLHDFDMNEDIHLGELSMGQKKKVFMCFALATNTSLLVMDEPSNGLDIPSKSQFRKVIASGMTDEKAVIISTHQVRDIDSLLDHVVIIDGTRVLLNESVKTICEKLYFVEQGMNESTDTALYVQPSVQGNSVIFPNTYNEETNLNLEVLFNAMLTERGKKCNFCLTSNTKPHMDTNKFFSFFAYCNGNETRDYGKLENKSLSSDRNLCCICIGNGAHNVETGDV